MLYTCIYQVNESKIRLNSKRGVFVWEKGSDLTQSCDKSPYTDRKIQKAAWEYKDASKNFDYTTIADQL